MILLELILLQNKQRQLVNVYLHVARDGEWKSKETVKKQVMVVFYRQEKHFRSNDFSHELLYSFLHVSYINYRCIIIVSVNVHVHVYLLYEKSLLPHILYMYCINKYSWTLRHSISAIDHASFDGAV